MTKKTRLPVLFTLVLSLSLLGGPLAIASDDDDDDEYKRFMMPGGPCGMMIDPEMIRQRQGMMMKRQGMMMKRQEMKQQHMTKVEGHLVNIEALLRELVELNKAK